MNARTVLGAAIAVVVAAAVPIAHGATSTSGAAQPAAAKHHKQAPAHHQSHAKHHEAPKAGAASTRDSEYQAALRGCVSGPSAQRESCLDDAVARHGRS